MGPAADLPGDEQPEEPAPEPAGRTAKKAVPAARRAPAKKAAKSPEAASPEASPTETTVRAKKAAARSPAKKAAAARSSAAKGPAKKTAAKAAPAEAAPPGTAPPGARPSTTGSDEAGPTTTDPATTTRARPATRAPSDHATPSDRAAPSGDATPPADATTGQTKPARARKRSTRQGGRFRRQGAVSEPTTSPIPKVPSRDPRRIQQRVAVVIPAKDEARRIAATVRSAKSIPQVDLVLVVDDGSEDSTQHVARDAGAVVVRHSHNRGKAAAMETGAAVVAMRDTPERPPRLLLFIDADLGETAVNTAPLIPPVAEHAADFSIALLPPQHGAGGRGMVVAAARKGVAQLTGWAPTQPLSGMRCLTRAAFEAATPLARGWGVETGMTIDLLRQGFVAVEVPCDLRHRASGNDLGGQLHRAAQYRDVKLAISARQVRGAVGAIKRAVTPRSSRHP